MEHSVQHATDGHIQISWIILCSDYYQNNGESMALTKKLNDSLNKEKGGRHGGKGHEFQRYWALCHLLQVDSESDYLLLLEFIEDVAVMNSESAPDQIELFQVKKKEGASTTWTKTTLGKPPKESKSIIAKLHESKSILENETSSIAFVSNSPVSLKLASGKDSSDLFEFTASQIDASLLSELKSSVAKELGSDVSKIDFSKLKFIKSTLAMDDLENHAIGKVSAFLAAKFPDHSHRADVLCRALYCEIKVKATSTEGASNFDELKKIRGISKAQFSNMVGQTLSRKSDTDKINEFLAILAQENVPYIQRQSIKRASNRFLVDKAGKGNNLLLRLQNRVESLLNILPTNLVSTWEVSNWIVEQILAQKDSSDYLILERDYMIAATLFWMDA